MTSAEIILELLKEDKEKYYSDTELIRGYEEAAGRRITKEELKTVLTSLASRDLVVYRITKDGTPTKQWKIASPTGLTLSAEIRDMLIDGIEYDVLTILRETREKLLEASAVKQHLNLTANDYNVIWSKTNTLITNLINQINKLEDYVNGYDGNDFTDNELKEVFPAEIKLGDVEKVGNSDDDYYPEIMLWG